jgi:hypothetical protein
MSSRIPHSLHILTFPDRRLYGLPLFRFHPSTRSASKACRSMASEFAAVDRDQYFASSAVHCDFNCSVPIGSSGCEGCDNDMILQLGRSPSASVATEAREAGTDRRGQCLCGCLNGSSGVMYAAANRKVTEAGGGPIRVSCSSSFLDGRSSNSQTLTALQRQCHHYYIPPLEYFVIPHLFCHYFKALISCKASICIYYSLAPIPLRI